MVAKLATCGFCGQEVRLTEDDKLTIHTRPPAGFLCSGGGMTEEQSVAEAEKPVRDNPEDDGDDDYDEDEDEDLDEDEDEEEED